MMRRLNQCRLYLQVTLLSEITLANGHNILPSYIQGNKHANQRSLLTWPRQDRPPLKAWQEWTKRLTQASLLHLPEGLLALHPPCSSE
jgi:hypothetical protein